MFLEAYPLLEERHTMGLFPQFLLEERNLGALTRPAFGYRYGSLQECGILARPAWSGIPRVAFGVPSAARDEVLSILDGSAEVVLSV
jgi:hypothetical protein